MKKNCWRLHFFRLFENFWKIWLVRKSLLNKVRFFDFILRFWELKHCPLTYITVFYSSWIFFEKLGKLIININFFSPVFHCKHLFTVSTEKINIHKNIVLNKIHFSDGEKKTFYHYSKQNYGEWEWALIHYCSSHH